MKLLKKSERADLCPHQIHFAEYAEARDVHAWCQDASRPGIYYVLTVFNLDSLSDDLMDSHYVTVLCVSDPDMAFEAKMLWG